MKRRSMSRCWQPSVNAIELGSRADNHLSGSKLIPFANERNAPLDELCLSSWFSKSQRHYLWNHAHGYLVF